MPSAAAAGVDAAAAVAAAASPAPPEEKKDEKEVIDIFTKTGVTYANNQVIGYDLASILRWGIFQMSAPKGAKGGNFFTSFAFIQALAITAISNIIFGVCVGFHKIGAFAADQQEVVVLMGVEQHFSAMTMLLFSFFVFKSLAAYNQIRSTHLGGLAGGLVNLMHVTRLWIPGLDEDDARFKATIKRWGLAAYGLTWIAASGTKSLAEGGVQELVARELLTEEEATRIAAVRPEPQVTTPLFWILSAYTERIVNDPALNGSKKKEEEERKRAQDKDKDGAKEEEAEGGRGGGASSVNRVAAKKLERVTEAVLKMRTGAMDTLTAVSSFGLQPLPIVMLMSFLIKLDIGIVCLKSGVEYVNIYLSGTDTPIMQYLLLTLMTLTQPLVYQALLEFVIQISNPFGDDWIDLPKLFMQSGLAKGLDMFTSAQSASMYDHDAQAKATMADPSLFDKDLNKLSTDMDGIGKLHLGRGMSPMSLARGNKSPRSIFGGRTRGGEGDGDGDGGGGGGGSDDKEDGDDGKASQPTTKPTKKRLTLFGGGRKSATAKKTTPATATTTTTTKNNNNNKEKTSAVQMEDGAVGGSGASARMQGETDLLKVTAASQKEAAARDRAKARATGGAAAGVGGAGGVGGATPASSGSPSLPQTPRVDVEGLAGLGPPDDERRQSLQRETERMSGELKSMLEDIKQTEGSIRERHNKNALED